MTVVFFTYANSHLPIMANTLTGLPAEILLAIQSYLSYGPHLALRLTCRDLYAKIEDPNRNIQTNSCVPTSDRSKNKAYSMTDLLEIERWPEYNAAEYRPAQPKQPIDQQDFFACHLCLKIRSAGQFSNAMMKGKRGKLGQGTIAERMQRFCITCGLSHQRYRRGTHLQFGGALRRHGFVCSRCDKFKEVRYGCKIQAAERICPSCYDRDYQGYESDDPFYISPDCGDWRDVLE